jgi:hypothetical protein
VIYSSGVACPPPVNPNTSFPPVFHNQACQTSKIAKQARLPLPKQSNSTTLGYCHMHQPPHPRKPVASSPDGKTATSALNDQRYGFGTRPQALSNRPSELVQKLCSSFLLNIELLTPIPAMRKTLNPKSPSFSNLSTFNYHLMPRPENPHRI